MGKLVWKEFKRAELGGGATWVVLFMPDRVVLSKRSKFGNKDKGTGNISNTRIEPVKRFLAIGVAAFEWNGLTTVQRTNYCVAYSAMGILPPRPALAPETGEPLRGGWDRGA